ncbi:MAG: GDP-mannose 4,6-dehydratase [Anaerolineae bacterium]|nr:GDP-mannose 4,6-dehydratase [Anaerolineae bacterium]
MSNKRVLVTGATGFVGAHLVRRLLEAHEDVHILIRPSSNLWRLQEIETQIKKHSGDLADAEGIHDIVTEIQPQVIYHLATLGAYPFQKDAEAIIRTNIFGAWNLLKACAGIDYEVFVNAGSSSEYGSKRFAMRETDVLEPNSYYAVSKSAQSLLCQHLARSENRPICTLRLFSVYGYYEEPTRLVPTLIRRCLNGQDLSMTSRYTARDFVFVDDVIDAFLQTEALAKAGPAIINVGTGVQHTLEDIVAQILTITGARVGVHWGEMEPRIWDTDTWVADITQSRRLLNWTPKTSLDEGLRLTVAWFKRYYGLAP